jgi:ribonuclease P protein component
MIRQKYRFHGYGSLNFLFQHGTSHRSFHLGLKFVKNPRRQVPRVAVIVSKKIFKHAVKRNRIRRRIYELIRARLDFTKNVDLVVIVLSDKILELSHEELDKELTKLLAKAQLTCVAVHPSKNQSVRT